MPHLLGPQCADKRDDYNAIQCDDPISIKRVLFYGQKPWNNFIWRDIKIRRTSGEKLPDKDFALTYDPKDEKQEPAWTVLPMTSNGQFHDIGSTWAIPFVMGQRY
jgi:hypothetical protein